MVIRSSSRQGAESSVGTLGFDGGTPTPASLCTVLYFRDEQAEEERISALKAEDPIAWQDWMDVEVARILVHHGGLLVEGIPGNENLSAIWTRTNRMRSPKVHRVCERATPEHFTKAKHMLQTLVVDLSMDINASCTLEERPDMFGHTALALAVQWRNPPLALELLALGADPNKGHR
ncbi:hypothetical protein FOZ63_008008, partial [Perkinsus olseni]